MLNLNALLPKLSGDEKAYILRVNSFIEQLHVSYFKTAGKEADDEMNQLWYDLETFRCIKIKYSFGYQLIQTMFNHLGIKGGTQTPEPTHYIFTNINVTKIPYIELGCMTPEENALITEPVRQLLNSGSALCKRLEMALFSGGLRVPELNDLSMEQISLLVSPCAIYLYNSGYFLRSSDLLAPHLLQMRDKILRHMNIIYKERKLPYAVEATVSGIADGTRL